MTEGPGDEPGGETLAHARAFVSLSAALMATDISTTTHRAPRVARARGGRGRPRRGRAPRRPRPRKLLAPQHPRARLPRRQGAAAGRDQARRPRGRARRGGPRVARRAGTAPRSTTRASSRSASPTSTSASCPSEGEPLKFSIEIGVRPKAELGEYKGLEVGKREPGRRRRGDRRGDRPACASARPSSSTVERQAAARRLRRDGLRRHARRRAVRRRRGPRPDDRARLGPARARLRGAARGRRRRRGAHGHGHLPRGLRRRPSSPARTPSSRSRSRRSRPSSCPRSTTTLADEAGFDTLDELREDIRSRMAEAEAPRIEAEFREAALDAAVDGRDDRGARRAVEARARELWDSMLHSLSHQGIDRETYLRISGTHRGGDDRAGQAGRRAGAAARGRAGRGRRGRVARAVRGRDARGGRRGGTSGREASRRRSCSSACGPTGAWTASRTTWRSARRWTCWPSRRKPVPVSRAAGILTDASARVNLAERPGSDRTVDPLLVFGRVVRHGPSAI